jgi:putative addiction module component (TIGR02574 family)
MMTVEQVVSEVDQMSEDQVVLLVDRLTQRLQTIDPEIEEAWSAEIRRRVDDLESGKVQEIPGEEVTARVRQLLTICCNEPGFERRGCIHAQPFVAEP